MIFDIYFDKYNHQLKKALNKTTQFRKSKSNTTIL
jgi:hypothetical protein